MSDLLIIDNYDSFTYNLVGYCQELGVSTHVYYNDKISIAEVKKLNPDKILISPGPGNTQDAGIANNIIHEFHKNIPILGVCLGHQCIAEYFGGKVIHAPRVMHGKTSIIQHDSSGIFSGIEQNFIACRYHSLIVDNMSVPECLSITARAEDDPQEIMALAHKSYPIFGVQFHPEAVLTEYGHQLLHNFLSI